MNLDLTEEQELLRDSFAQLLAAESSFDRVRAAEATGFDPQLWKHLSGEGAMVSAFKKDAMIEVASRLMDLTAPESVLQRGAEGAIDGGALEFGYRLATANAIYGGTAEILKSIVAQSALGMPRSRG